MPDATIEAVGQLKARIAPIVDIRAAAGVLSWDQQTHMPPGGGRARAEQLATLRRIAHEMFTAARTVELLEAAEAVADRFDPDSDEAALIRMTRRDLDRALKLPSEFVAERARAAALSVEVWRRARPANDFLLFRPHLEQMVNFARRTADYLGYEGHPYNALLDQYEPLMTVRDLTLLFNRLREATVPLVRAIADRGQVVDATFLTREYDEANRRRSAGRSRKPSGTTSRGVDWIGPPIPSRRAPAATTSGSPRATTGASSPRVSSRSSTKPATRCTGRVSRRRWNGRA